MIDAMAAFIKRLMGFAGILASCLAPAVAHAEAILTGVNFVHPSLFSVAEQNAALAQMKIAGVRVIRFGMEDKEDENLDFIKRATAQNIRVVLIFHCKYALGAPVRPYRPKEFPGMWQGPAISSLDPGLSRIYFQQFIDKLDAAGVALAGIELENEINMAGNNPDFRLPGEGRVLGLDDLYHDPEGQQVAKGYLQYLKVLAALKDVRDHSRLSRRAPLLQGGAGASPDLARSVGARALDEDPRAAAERLTADGRGG